MLAEDNHSNNSMDNSGHLCAGHSASHCSYTISNSILEMKKTEAQKKAHYESKQFARTQMLTQLCLIPEHLLFDTEEVLRHC